VQIGFRIAKCGADEVEAGRTSAIDNLTWYLFCVKTQKEKKNHGRKNYERTVM
jgi:hypothetical protein